VVSFQLTLELYGFLPIILPIVSAIIIAIIGKFTENKGFLGTVNSLMILIATYFTIRNFMTVLKTGVPIVASYNAYLPPIGSCLEIDLLSAFFAMLFTFIGLCVSIYSIGYMEKEGIRNYFMLLSILIASLVGVVYAGDFFTLFIFYEMLGVSAYILVAFYKNEEAIEAAVKYLIMGAAGSALILYGLALIYGLTGTLNMALVMKIMSNTQISYELYPILVLFLVGFGVKAAIFPMHSWLPDAHPAAPSGISAMLSGVVIKAGLYAMFRTLFILFYGKNVMQGYFWNINISLIFAGIAVLTVTIPNFIALVQKDIKRTLAYSSIYNMGIVFAGIAIGTKLAIAAALFHILNHAVAKALLFMDSGAFITEAKTREIEELRGIGKKMPVSGLTFVTGSLSLAGLPPLAGFYSKFLLIWAAILAIFDGNIVGYIIAITLAINATVSLGYYFGSLVRNIWFVSEPSERAKDAREFSKTIAVSEILLVIVIVCVSFLPFIVMDIFTKIVESLLNTNAYINAVISS